MVLRRKARHLPQRITTGAFILNSGLGKWSADDETAARLHGFASRTYPFRASPTPAPPPGWVMYLADGRAHPTYGRRPPP
jgi:hypothetical protein